MQSSFDLVEGGIRDHRDRSTPGLRLVAIGGGGFVVVSLCGSLMFGFVAGNGLAAIIALAAALVGAIATRRQAEAMLACLRDALAQADADLGTSLATAQALERRLAEEEAELTRLRAAEADLVAAHRNAEAAALAKGEFLATMSHEIRTPLNGVLPILELVLSQELDVEVRRQVAAALESSREMRRIVNDILDFSKFEAGKLQLEVASIRPIEIAQSVAQLMKRTAEGKQLKLVCEIAPNVPPMVRGDALRFRQVLTNLVGNAIKFTRHGEVKIEMSEVGSDRTHRMLRVAVRDTGPGIAPEAASRLFQPFSQADAGTARAHGGTGLGLAICHRIVESMGGRIGVESTLGRGATFWFVVPFLRPAGEQVGGDLSNALLLTRDDSLSESWARRLLGFEFDCTRVGTAYEALGLLREAESPSEAMSLVVIDAATAARTATSVVRAVLADPKKASRAVVVGEPLDGLEESAHPGRIAYVPRQATDADAQRTLRRLLSDPTLGDPGAPIVALTRGPQQRFDGLRVLLVDDIAINRYAGEATLRKLGATVTVATGGREALAVLEKQRFDLVLMDCQMPDVDGFAATRALRARERDAQLPRTPVLAVTANAMPGDRENCLAAGMDDHLPKPIELQTLTALLVQWAPRQAPLGEVA
jgi:signal transduction histidine kinase/CheY-like chemotaxis protein